MFSALIMRFFWQKNRELGTLEKLETMMKKDCLFEKKFSFFQNAKAQKWEGAKYAGHSRPSCYKLIIKFQIKELNRRIEADISRQGPNRKPLVICSINQFNTTLTENITVRLHLVY